MEAPKFVKWDRSVPIVLEDGLYHFTVIHEDGRKEDATITEEEMKDFQNRVWEMMMRGD